MNSHSRVASIASRTVSTKTASTTGPLIFDEVILYKASFVSIITVQSAHDSNVNASSPTINLRH